MSFGTIPYSTVWYGEPCESSAVGTSEQMDLRKILVASISGDLSGVSRLISMMDSDSEDIRRYAAQLLADTCNHEQVSGFSSIHSGVRSIPESCRNAMRLGDTLSLQAISMLLDFALAIDHPTVSEHVFDALEMILPIDDLDETLVTDSATRDEYEAALSSLDPDLYYYKGQPVFVGDVCKELINAAVVASSQGTKIILVSQANLLSNFSGVLCPVKHGDEISADLLQAVYGYVGELSKMEWNRGEKRFFGHRIN